MAVGTAFASPLLDAGQIRKYAYRQRMGMVPSAEFDVFHDDFHSFMVSTAITNGPVANTPLDFWQGAIIDTGATVAANTTAAIGANGVLTFADATASEGAAIYTTKSFQITSGKRFFVEMRVRTDDVTDNAVQFGLSDQTAVTNPEDLWTTTAANVLAFGLLDGSAYPQLLSDKSNSGTSAQTQTNKIMVADTWHVLAIGYDGATVRTYVDGDVAHIYSTTASIPTGVAMGLFIGHINGNGAGGNGVFVDYIRSVSER
jgi:Concanavalin A-like lectin/glucanases superfamily